MNRAGQVGSVYRDLGTSVNDAKNQLRNYEKFQLGQAGSHHCDAEIPARRA